MSQENVELAKRFNEAGQRGDVDSALEFIAEDVVVQIFDAPFDAAQVRHGRQGLFEAYAQLAEIFEGLRREVDEYIDAGDWVIAVGRWVGEGKESGIPVEGRTNVNALRWHGGKVVEYLLGFDSKAQALEAVGLRE
jgi:ketosteroid isomerase-like protein